MEHIDKIRNEIAANNGLTPDEIADKFFGMKKSPINKNFVEKMLKIYKEFHFDGEKWQVKEIKTWEKADFNFENESESFGVFGFYDENKKIIFVGSAINMREKLLSLDNEELRKSAVSYITSPTETEEKALDTEQKLIAKHQPRLNS